MSENDIQQSSIEITANGEAITVTTTLSLKDLEANGVGGCQPVKQLKSETSQIIRLGTYLNLADILHECGRNVDELGILRRARREFDAYLSGQKERIVALLASELPLPAMPDRWTIVALDRDEPQFKRLAGIDGNVYANFWHPGAKLGGLAGTRNLDILKQPADIDNASFHVCFNGSVVATVPVAINATHVAGWVTNHPSSGCMPIEIHFAQDATERDEAYKIIVSYLQYMARSFGADNFTIAERPEDHFALYKQIIKKARSYSAEIWDSPYVDLTAPEEQLFANVRKSYKSNINWCAKNLTTEYFSGEQINNESSAYFFNVIQDLHQELIAKYTDGMTQELFYHPILMCANGQGEVAISKTADGTPYGISVTTYDNGIAYYALAGSREVMRGKNPGHFIVYDAIRRAKARGQTRYVMNRFFGASVSLNQTDVKVMIDRAFNISFFKRGYSGDCSFANVYQVFT
ncbi:GNAT family N-acetyltransferase [Herbaspirillum sp.]|uniref:GNAT family N-acetyltransferase n=1 Tax=Herbaspirillum sp. TaxID=1890675 RepID=UPI001B1258CD|nr:GNAT family N-acetyltransferase [Herbaspirillum sp.]MBO9536360.1 hypothetical protein [Herbaspirillum sp.]